MHGRNNRNRAQLFLYPLRRGAFIPNHSKWHDAP